MRNLVRTPYTKSGLNHCSLIIPDNCTKNRMRSPANQNLFDAPARLVCPPLLHCRVTACGNNVVPTPWAYALVADLAHAHQFPITFRKLTESPLPLHSAETKLYSLRRGFNTLQWKMPGMRPDSLPAFPLLPCSFHFELELALVISVLDGKRIFNGHSLPLDRRVDESVCT